MGRNKSTPGRRKLKRWLTVLMVLILASGATWFMTDRESRSGGPKYLTATVERGRIVSKVSSTGTVNPVTTVKVGSEISGLIKEIFVDYNSAVKAGQVVALIDPERFEAKVRQAEADLALAKANLVMQQASLEKAKTEPLKAEANLASAVSQATKALIALEKAGKDLKRYEELHKRSVISSEKYDEIISTQQQAEAMLKAAASEKEAQKALVKSTRAALKMASAQIDQAAAQVLIKEAALKSVRIDLERTVIKSPVDGVVISRDVDVGQTVAASFQAPTLFTIAQDLRKMQVEVALDEADIGRIREGQKAIFTVDAFPDKQYQGLVGQIRKSPQNVQNVVTYTVIVTSDNKDQSLMPGMTANVELIIAELPDALRVPNSALRFKAEGVAVASSGGQAGTTRNGSGQNGAKNRAAERLQKMTDELGLDKGQQEGLKAITARIRERVAALRKAGTPREEIQRTVAELRRQSQGEIIALLNVQQQAKYRRLISDRQANPTSRSALYLQGPDGRLRAVEVVCGLTDGSFTQIVQGPVKAGDRVVTGIKRAPKDSDSGGIRLRL